MSRQEIICRHQDEEVVGHTVKKADGEWLDVIVESLPSTGAQWRLVRMEPGVELVDVRNITEDQQAELLGGVAKQLWSFRLKSAGQFQMHYGRTWENEPWRQLIVHVNK